MHHGRYATVLYGTVIAAVETGVGLGRATTKRRLSVVLPLAGLAFAFLAGAIWAKTITGTAGNDTLRGTPAADVLSGKGGHDTLYGLAGYDCLVGGLGDDRLVGGPGADALACGGGRDTAIADARDRVATDCEVVKGLPKGATSANRRRRRSRGRRSTLAATASTSNVSVAAARRSFSSKGSRAPRPRSCDSSSEAALAAETRVCWYDRAGVGESDRRPAGLAPTGTRLSNEAADPAGEGERPRAVRARRNVV